MCTFVLLWYIYFTTISANEKRYKGLKRSLRLFILLIAASLFLTSCSSDFKILPKKEATAYSEKTYSVKNAVKINFDCDNANIEFYTWNKDDVKIESTKRTRGNSSEEILKEELAKFEINESQDNSTINFKSRYDGLIKEDAGKSIDLKVYLPIKVDSVHFNVKTGSVKFVDDISCNIIDGSIDTGNCEILHMKGCLVFSGDISNLKLKSGILTGGSKVTINTGNIYTNSYYTEGKNYSYENDIGTVEICAPATSKISFETIGMTEANDFSSNTYPTVVKVKNNMGKITIRKN